MIDTSIINVVRLVYCLTFELLTQVSSLGCVVSLSISILNVEISDPSTWQEKNTKQSFARMNTNI